MMNDWSNNGDTLKVFPHDQRVIEEVFSGTGFSCHPARKCIARKEERGGGGRKEGVSPQKQGSQKEKVKRENIL